MLKHPAAWFAADAGKRLTAFSDWLKSGEEVEKIVGELFSTDLEVLASLKEILKTR